jgi:CheY-like chemotaxis protein/predicted regulator of Ras-like GTPase activity (Roadblock/LC7/MglB family)
MGLFGFVGDDGIMHHILIVDEEEHLLWALEKNLFPERDDIAVISASSGEAGLELLKSRPIDVLVCDIKMPGKVDGFQLILRAKEAAPEARVVIMTAFGTSRIQNLADRIGITHYVEKPFNISELRNVLLELLDAKEGFQGVLSDLELTDIIQMLCLAKRTALLHLKHRDHRGRIVFERGDVVHAEFDKLVGDVAVYKMLALRQGDIYMQSDFQNDKRSITMGWQDLLLEGVRRADEHRADSEAEERAQQAREQSVRRTVDGDYVVEDSGIERLPPRLVGEIGSEGSDSDANSFFSDDELEEIEQAARAASASSAITAAEDMPTTPPSDATMPRRAITGAHTPIPPRTIYSASPAPLPSAPPSPSASPPPAIEPPPRVNQETPISVGPFGTRPPSGTFNPPRLSGVFPPVQPVAPPNPNISQIPGVTTQHSPSTSQVPGFAPPLNPGQSYIPGVNAPALPTPTGSWGASGYVSGGLASGTYPVPTASMVHYRTVLLDFVRECIGLKTTGIFSLEDGMALDFVPGSWGNRHDTDALSAFFREVVASAARTAQALHEQDAFQELQIVMSQDLVLLRQIGNTSYAQIAVISKDVRIGIAIVLMRRINQRLAACFTT